jgi:urease accessory protein UreF
MMLYSYCASTTGSAIRMGTISHFEGQEILAALANDVNSLVPSNRLDEVWQLNPLAEILQMRHEQDEFRMFIT